MQDLSISWAINTFKKHGYEIQEDTPETIQSTPWSEVCRFATDRGFVYLKMVPPAIALEAKIIMLLRMPPIIPPIPILIVVLRSHIFK